MGLLDRLRGRDREAWQAPPVAEYVPPPQFRAGALYTSVPLDEDWLRAALYLIVFVTLALTGPGRFSIDRRLQIRKINRATGTALSKS